MNAYDLTRHAIEAAQWLVVPALMYLLRRVPTFPRFFAVLVLGWYGMFLLVVWYWNYAIFHAPTEQLREYYALRDGGQAATAYAYGWFGVIAYMAVIEALRFVLSWAKRRRESSHAVHISVAALIVSLGGVLYGCNPPRRQTPVATVSTNEEHCWWAVYRTSLPLDTVVNRFARAFASIGFAPSAPSQFGDTAWINVGPSRVAGYEGRPIAARMVAYRAGDSTHFRTFVETGASQAIPLCQQISQAAPVGGITLREPDGEEKLSVWRRRP